MSESKIWWLYIFLCIVFISVTFKIVLLDLNTKEPIEYNNLPELSSDVKSEGQGHTIYRAIDEPKAINTVIREVSAYNVGDINQTDSNPCLSANGENICVAIDQGYKRCAANFVPFGTLLKIENYGICQVTDRMHSKYKNRVDIAFAKGELTEAIQFGIKKLNVSILD